MQALDLWLTMLRHRPPAPIPSAATAALEPLPQTPLLAVYPLLLRLGLATAIGDFLRPAMELLEEYLLAFVRAVLLYRHAYRHLTHYWSTTSCRMFIFVDASYLTTLDFCRARHSL